MQISSSHRATPFPDSWALYRKEQQAFLTNEPKTRKVSGNFNARSVLDIVRIDHIQADAFVVDPWLRRSIGQPWLTLAIDIASRCVVDFSISMTFPNSSTVVPLTQRAVRWQVSLGFKLSTP